MKILAIKSILIVGFVLAGLCSYGQSTSGAAQPGNTTDVTPGQEAKDEIKAVPQARSKAKPQRLDRAAGNSARSTSARPVTSRPARSTRPSGRPVVPGRVR